jgi:predicted nucleotidyltransferase
MVLFMNNDDAGVRDRPSDSVGALDFDRRALDDLCRKFRVRRLDLFGSATTGHFDPARSDVDLLVEFEAMPPSAYAAAYFGLRAAAETLLGRPVDLVTEAALANPYLRRRIEGERRTLFPQP